MPASRWAIILCKFADDSSPTRSMEHYRRLFTGSGNGSLNMVDFFADMSHGRLDLSASQVFGWFTLALHKADYTGPHPSVDRNGLVAACRQAATDGGVNLAGFDGVVISMNGAVDLFGYVGGMEAFCDSNSLSPSPLGQEMGHGYGLDHARRDGSTADYQDPWDVMSVYAADMAPNGEWGTVGPGLNAWCMRSRGWLDEARVWTPSSSHFDRVIQLRPLHRHDLPGLLAASLDQFLIEYRPNQRWDAGFPRSAVFVHRFADNHSYVMPGTGGNFDLTAGDAFEQGNPSDRFEDYSRLDVVALDDQSLTATIRLQHRAGVRFPVFQVGGQIVGAVAVDGGGGIIIGGQFHPIPPWGPEVIILQALVNYVAVRELPDVSLRSQVQRAALAEISTVVAERTSQLEPLRSPAPQQHKRGEETIG